ncbi:hypothetical protein HMPREF1870_02526 [Bacteroidales bacterium KA00344]|nr:hypothetical protein HMPREF1870_02526 [Bacteroidales bacterium KA00344]
MLFHFVNITSCPFTAKVIPKELKTKPFTVLFLACTINYAFCHIKENASKLCTFLSYKPILAIGAEPHSDEQRKRIEYMLGVKAYNSFGMSGLY